VSICIARLAYNASNALLVTNLSRQLHGNHVPIESQYTISY